LRLLEEKQTEIAKLIDFISNFSVKADRINPFLERIGTSPLKRGVKLVELLSRPHIDIETLIEEIAPLKEQVEKIPNRREEIVESANIKIKYDGYIKREKLMADKISRLEDIRIKDKFNYNEIQSLSTEARQKLTKINPETIAQASRIPGVSPNDISVLLILLGR
jgi:tRNA uridine 5-carboxymethylaminomethyl modification enzyme